MPVKYKQKGEFSSHSKPISLLILDLTVKVTKHSDEGYF